MRKLISVIAAMALAGAGGWAAVAASGSGRTPVNCIDSLWRTAEVSTTSKTFTKVPGSADAPASIFPIIVNVSASVSGAPVEFRVLSTNVGGQTSAGEPGSTRFVPAAGGADSFSYQWIVPNGSAAIHANDLRLQWRSPSGKAVHLLRADMAVSYDTTKGACTG